MINFYLLPQKFTRYIKRVLFGNIIYTKCCLTLRKIKWRQQNQHNHTYVKNFFHLNLVQIGQYTYGPLEIYDFDDCKNKLIIKSFVSIAEGVKFILGGNHYSQGFSNYPLKVNLLKHKTESLSNGPIIVESDVWIGMNATILSGVTIGQGAIIGCEAVVAKNIPPYAIAVGNPVVIKKFRFEEKIIGRLLNINFETISEEMAKKIAILNYDPLDDKILDEIENIMQKKIF